MNIALRPYSIGHEKVNNRTKVRQNVSLTKKTQNDTFNKSVSFQKLENLYKVNKRLLRGSIPEIATDIDILINKFKIKTIISLESINKNVKKYAEKKGLKIIERSDFYKSEKKFSETIKFMNDDKLGQKYIHCTKGIHRTGLMVLFDKIYYGNVDESKAFKEYKDIAIHGKETPSNSIKIKNDIKSILNDEGYPFWNKK